MHVRLVGARLHELLLALHVALQYVLHLLLHAFDFGLEFFEFGLVEVVVGDYALVEVAEVGLQFVIAIFSDFPEDVFFQVLGDRLDALARQLLDQVREPLHASMQRIKLGGQLKVQSLQLLDFALQLLISPRRNNRGAQLVSLFMGQRWRVQLRRLLRRHKLLRELLLVMELNLLLRLLELNVLPVQVLGVDDLGVVVGIFEPERSG